MPLSFNSFAIDSMEGTWFECEFAGKTSNITKAKDRRLSTDLADVSNLDKNNKPFSQNDPRRIFNLGNRLWHTDSSFKAIPAKYSLLSARSISKEGGNTEFADMRRTTVLGEERLM